MNRQELPMAGKPLIGVGHRTDIRLLNEEEIRFEIDMCIGCDRCMRACPVPLSTMVNIAELNRATITDEIAPHVARFTDECVMCGSCVPVCPVDNHRDLLMLSLKQRLGIAWDGKVDMGRILGFLPVGWDLPLLLSRLREQPMFSNEQLVGDNYLLHLVATSKLRTLMPGTVLMYEGDFGRDLYFVLEGRFELTSSGPAGNELPVAILRRGEYLGEHGMLTGQPRNATARAQTAALVLEVPEQVMQHLLEIVPALQHFFEQLTIMRSLESMLRQMALFQGVSSVDMRHMAEQTEVKRYERGERLFSEKRAERPAREALHLLLEGFVKVARQTAAGTGQGKSDERIIAYRQGGDYFAGGLDMLGDRRAVTVTTITRTRVAEVPRQVMTALLARYPEVNQRFQERILAYYGANAAANSAVFEPFNFRETGALKNSLSDAEARAGLHSLVGDGVVEGTEVLVIDLDRCVHCNECEEACERRHGHSRMNRKGMVVGNISIATACRQCQDPVCLLCSRAGIARMPGGEVYITESCIGCGICAERCPYDNISIMTLDEEKDDNAQSAWQRFNNFFSQGAGKERGRKVLPMAAAPGPLLVSQPTDAYGEIRKKLAIKCDLCAGYDNQACVQACPTGAAIRINPVTFFGSTEEILRSRAK
ncbi:MAG TPA: cyclic nucleotide-binding domain-containing protein [Ktedonobacteraceae bacterium]|nr:cyclic nucleotide-binding domain-containing protein [Ktedonobacteraceae bacterium]